jgi:hypothetical protein
VSEPTIKDKEKTWKFRSPKTVTVEPTIQLLFFKNNGDQHVKIVEVDDISWEELIQHLNQGHSILITRKRANEEKSALNVDEEMSEPWYFAHI